MTEAVQIVLAKRPSGDVTPDCFREEKATLPALADGQVLIRQRFLSLDPYMRPRMTETRSYTPPCVLGKPSFTAWYGIRQICKPKAGETVFVSAATGAVGQVAGQLAKLSGARVVGCAGDEDKCRWAVREAGYDACFNHKTERDYGAVLDKLCPQGIDADFENVGGRIFHAVFERLNNFGRLAFCGAISEYQDAAPMAGPPKMFTIVQRRLTIQGFIVSDHIALMGEFASEVGGLLKDGKLKSRETVVDGLAKAPEAFLGLLRGENFGKLVVRVQPSPRA